MKYTLITKKGSVMQFFIEEMANTYQSIYGGVVFTGEVLEQKTVDIPVK